MEKVNIDRLITDYNLYPRNKVDDQHVVYMIEAINSGVILPPVIADKESKRVIDGFHRLTAHRKLKISEINVIYKVYKSDSDMFIDSIKYNAGHGRMLTQFDKAHCLIKAEEMGLSIDITSEALSITVKKAEEIKRDKIGELKISSHLTGARQYIPLKNTIRHMRGQELTDNQISANERLSGMNQVFYVNQIIDLIENDLLNKNSEKLMTQLNKLYKLLENIII